MVVLRSFRWVLFTGCLHVWTVMLLTRTSPWHRTKWLKPAILRRLVGHNDDSVTPSTTDPVWSATHHESQLADFPSQDEGCPPLHPAFRIEDQSLPEGYCFLPSIWQVGNFAQLQLISYHLSVTICTPSCDDFSNQRVAPHNCPSFQIYKVYIIW
jgi:hypothetical protein